MIRMLSVALLYAVLFSQAPTSPRPLPADVLRMALKALERIESIAYDVRREYANPADRKIPGRTKILAARTPFRFNATFQADDSTSRDMAVSDGLGMRISAGGSIDESPAVFSTAYPKDKPMRVMNEATADVAGTWRVLLDRAFLEEAASSPDILYVKQEEIEGDPCHVVLVLRSSDLFEAVTTYYWISSKTGMPRAVQNMMLVRGRTSLTPRFIISNIHLNPTIPLDAFSYRPTPDDSSAVPKAKSTPPATTASGTTPVGKLLPALEVRDLDFKPLRLSDLKGKPLLVDFWAPWCGPCIQQFPVLQTLQDYYKGELRIVAVAVQDSRLNVTRFIQNNPKYRFTFLTDPNMPDEKSPLASFFGVSGIPVSVFVDARGGIIDRWTGFDGEEALKKRIQRLMGR
jgi:thiol-disulfide isomerase/thioredoxin